MASKTPLKTTFSGDTSDFYPSPDVNPSAVVSNAMAASWDPLLSHDWTNQKPPTTTIIRIKKDLMEIYKDPPPGILIMPDPDDITLVYALLTGPFDTPYEGGFFLFVLRFSPNYPLTSPRVRLLTTANNTVRFNPNLYKNGKVCLSTIGTWPGPGWTPAHTLCSVLVSIQSLMNEKPYHNEPGFAKERSSGDCEQYSECIQHETIRVAVCGMLEGGCARCSADILALIRNLFLEYYDHYVNVCEDKKHLDGKKMQDPFKENRGNFAYGELLKKLKHIYAEISAPSKPTEESCSSTSSTASSEL